MYNGGTGLLSLDTCCKEGSHPNLGDVLGTRIQLVNRIRALSRIRELRIPLQTKRRTTLCIARLLGTKYA